MIYNMAMVKEKKKMPVKKILGLILRISGIIILIFLVTSYYFYTKFLTGEGKYPLYPMNKKQSLLAVTTMVKN